MKKWIEEKMRTAKNVEDWNRLREEVKQQEPENMLENIANLDQSGLITEVLGKDSTKREG